MNKFSFRENQIMLSAYLKSKSQKGLGYESKITVLFDKLLKKREHISLVIDEFGAVRGIVTLEDIIETLLGLEIVDETDTVVDLQVLAKKRRKQYLKDVD
mgnify:CR=1 FL=1